MLSQRHLCLSLLSFCTSAYCRTPFFPERYTTEYRISKALTIAHAVPSNHAATLYICTNGVHLLAASQVLDSYGGRSRKLIFMRRAEVATGFTSAGNHVPRKIKLSFSLTFVYADLVASMLHLGPVHLQYVLADTVGIAVAECCGVVQADALVA